MNKIIAFFIFLMNLNVACTLDESTCLIDTYHIQLFSIETIILRKLIQAQKVVEEFLKVRTAFNYNVIENLSFSIIVLAFCCSGIFYFFLVDNLLPTTAEQDFVILTGINIVLGYIFCLYALLHRAIKKENQIIAVKISFDHSMC